MRNDGESPSPDLCKKLARGSLMIEEMVKHVREHSSAGALKLRNAMTRSDVGDLPPPTWCQVHAWHPCAVSACRPRQLTKGEKVRRHNAMISLLRRSGIPISDRADVWDLLEEIDAELGVNAAPAKAPSGELFEPQDRRRNWATGNGPSYTKAPMDDHRQTTAGRTS